MFETLIAGGLAALVIVLALLARFSWARPRLPAGKGAPPLDRGFPRPPPPSHPFRD